MSMKASHKVDSHDIDSSRRQFLGSAGSGALLAGMFRAATVKLVDHALSRVARKGLLAELVVEGPADPALFRSFG